MKNSEGFESRAQRRARREYVCDLCLGAIPVGQEYIRQSGIEYGQFYDEITHVHCDALEMAYPGGGAREHTVEAIRGWVGNAVCPGCPERERCKENPFGCRKVIERVVPETYRDAAIRSLEGGKHGG